MFSMYPLVICVVGHCKNLFSQRQHFKLEKMLKQIFFYTSAFETRPDKGVIHFKNMYSTVYENICVITLRQINWN